MTTKKPTILLWHGGNTYELYSELMRWKKAFEKKYSHLDTITFSESDFTQEITARHLSQAVQNGSLFSPTTFIILKNLLSAKKISPEIQHSILSFLKHPGENTFVLFYQTDEIQNIEVEKAITKLEKNGRATIKEFPLPKTPEMLTSWLAGYAKRNKIAIDMRALRLLITMTTDLTGFRARIDATALWSATQELMKLATFTNGRPITEADIMTQQTAVQHDELWKLVSSILSGDIKQSSAMLERRLRTVPAGSQPAELRTLLTLVSSQVKSMLAVKRLSGPALAQFAKEARWSKGREFMVKKQAEQLSEERLIHLQKKLVTLFETSILRPKLLKAEMELLLV